MPVGLRVKLVIVARVITLTVTDRCTETLRVFVTVSVYVVVVEGVTLGSSPTPPPCVTIEMPGEPAPEVMSAVPFAKVALNIIEVLGATFISVLPLAVKLLIVGLATVLTNWVRVVATLSVFVTVRVYVVPE